MQETPLWVDKYKEQLAILNDVRKWELIRKWSLSEVWRIQLKSSEALIFKKGSNENAREVNIYKDLLIPLEVNIPNVYKTYKHHSIGIVIMEEKKGMTLEKEPLYDGFIQAAKELSVLRSNATNGITQGKLSNRTNKLYYMKKENILRDLTYISAKKTYLQQDERAILTNLLNGLPEQLTRLYKHFPITLTHDDYHPKNLIYHNGEVVIIDWAYAYLSPHLGDLYCLIQSAKDYNIPSRDLIEAYCEGLDKRLVMDIEWQIKIGGMCWAIYALRNLIDFGIDAIPDAKEWLPGLVSDMRNLMNDIERADRNKGYLFNYFGNSRGRVMYMKLETAKQKTIDMLMEAGIVLTEEEKEKVEIANFGLDRLEKEGLQLITYENNDYYCAKELVLFPKQTCPEHKHPAIGESLGKQETFRCRKGKVYLYVEGDNTPVIQANLPEEGKAFYTVFYEIILHPGEQYTIPPNTLHWFQASEQGAIVSEFSTTSRDEYDIFTNPHIQR